MSNLPAVEATADWRTLVAATYLGSNRGVGWNSKFKSGYGRIRNAKSSKRDEQREYERLIAKEGEEMRIKRTLRSW